MVWQIFILILAAAAIAAVLFYQRKTSQEWEIELIYLTRHMHRAQSEKTERAQGVPQSVAVVPNYRDARKALKNKRVAVQRYEDAAAQKQSQSSKKTAAAEADLRDLPIFADYPAAETAENRSADAPADENAAPEVSAADDNAAPAQESAESGADETLPEVSGDDGAASFEAQGKSVLAHPAEDLPEITLDDILRRRPERRQVEQTEPKTISLEDIRSRQGWRTHPLVAPEIIGADKVRRRLKNIEVRDSAGKTEAVETISEEDIRAQLLRRRQARRQDENRKPARADALQVIGEEEVLRNLANIDSPARRHLPRETVRESIIPPAARIGGAHTLSAQELPEEPIFTRFTPYLHNTRKRNSGDGARKERSGADRMHNTADTPVFPPAEGLLTGFKPLSAAALAQTESSAPASADSRRAAREAQFADFFRQRGHTDSRISAENSADGTAIDFSAGRDLPPLDWTPPDASDSFADSPHFGQAEKKTPADFPAINSDNGLPFAGLTLLPEEKAADVFADNDAAETSDTLPFNVSDLFGQPEEKAADVFADNDTAETPDMLPFNVSDLFRQPEEKAADVFADNDAAETPDTLPFNVSDLFRQPEKKKAVHFPHRLLPDLSLLNPPETDAAAVRQSEEDLIERGVTIEEKLAEFRVKVRVVDAYAGPVITRYEIEPDTGVRGNQVMNLEKDLARALGCASIRIVETIPGKTCMGLELPNPQRQTIRLSEILGAPVFAASKSKLTIALGQDITGQPVITDLARAPHLLVAGTTGSGKSVGVNAMILSMLFKATPEEVRLIMIDPKMLELSIYEGIPHLLAPVVTDMRLAANALTWCVNEMEKRYRLMSHLGVRNIAGYNQRVREAARRGEKLGNPFSLTPDNPEPLEILPAIVVVVDEFADLMMTAGKKIEELIARIAQKARAAGIHMILATQRPSVDVITGLIKANIPTRIAFQVASKVDSRTILDQMGAENLLGQGDMLFLPPGSGYPRRVHGAFVADDEVHRVVEHLKQFGEPDYIDDILTAGVGADDLFSNAVGGSGGDTESDALYDEAVAFVLKTRKASISAVQRQFRIGYQRAARMIDQMENDGLISAPEHNGSRSILAPGGME